MSRDAAPDSLATSSGEPPDESLDVQISRRQFALAVGVVVVLMIAAAVFGGWADNHHHGFVSGLAVCVFGLGIFIGVWCLIGVLAPKIMSRWINRRPPVSLVPSAEYILILEQRRAFSTTSSSGSKVPSAAPSISTFLSARSA